MRRIFKLLSLLLTISLLAISCDELQNNPDVPNSDEIQNNPDNPEEPNPEEPGEPEIVYELTVAPEAFMEIPAQGDTITLSITSNAPWEISVQYSNEENSWLELSAVSGENSSDISVVAETNEVEAIREALIVVSLVGVDTVCTASIPISQLGAEKPLKTYRRGETYDENGKKGTVFYVTEDGTHGKIVSDASEDVMYWATEVSVTGATDQDNGMNNMKVIQAIEGWEEKFPAFAWCAALGESWYLPARNELNAIDGLFAEYGTDYWSSTEYSDERAYAKSFYTAEEYQYRKCMYPVLVRAVCEF